MKTQPQILLIDVHQEEATKTKKQDSKLINAACKPLSSESQTNL